ncbi:unnamed protein product [Acanthoscelides obtectus]|uniref:Uncharacterized protein n=1 Tax=Acanthoscelides obtectus TaxID=200917 RepID=A0A9P0KIU8_ACAOB|nr:unnamed protein product [Acanthoscelides obtectus]CAK1646933.1 hypothetical protein AOBTE_LOCUS14953 [Acanthoscelides obtectus]
MSSFLSSSTFPIYQNLFFFGANWATTNSLSRAILYLAPFSPDLHLHSLPIWHDYLTVFFLFASCLFLIVAFFCSNYCFSELSVAIILRPAILRFLLI